MVKMKFKSIFLGFAFTHFVLMNSAFGSVINGGFESGSFSGWSTTGEAIVAGAALGSGPASGNFNALITTGAGTFGDPAQSSIGVADLETFLGLAAGAIDGLISTTSLIEDGAVEGSAIKQTVTVAAGDTMSFDVSFLTNEITPEDFFIDTAFVTFSGIGLLFNANSPSFVSSGTTFFERETGFAHFSHTFTSGGTYTLGFGVVDVEDDLFDSALLIDNVQVVPAALPLSSVTAVPEAGTLALFGFGLLSLVICRRRGNG